MLGKSGTAWTFVTSVRVEALSKDSDSVWTRETETKKWNLRWAPKILNQS